jgi:hypothetical protein
MPRIRDWQVMTVHEVYELSVMMHFMLDHLDKDFISKLTICDSDSRRYSGWGSHWADYATYNL